MNRTEAVSFLNDLLTDQRDRFLRELLDTGDDTPELLPDDLPKLADLVDLDAVAGRVFGVSDDGTHTLHDWATLKQITAVAEQHERERSPVFTPVDLPCPDWCDKPPGHPFDRYSTTTRREHVHRFGERGVVVTLEQIERSPDPSTGITDIGIDPAATTLRVQYGPGQIGYLTSGGARRLAAQLLDAADLHDTHGAESSNSA